LRAASAIKMALSPAKTRSIKMIASNADHQGAEKSSTDAPQEQSITTRYGAEKRDEWEPDRRFAPPHG
jgi:hypothetical protein